MNEKEILNEIHYFNDGQKIALLLTIIADVSDGNLHDDEWNLIQSNLVKVKDKKDSKEQIHLIFNESLEKNVKKGWVEQ